MKTLQLRSRAAWLLSLGLLAMPALADEDCDAPVREWQPREAVMQMAERQGWQVQRLKIDDGCYEIRGRDASGQAFKARIDPRTLSVVRFKKRSDEHERNRDRDRDRERDPDGPRGRTE